MSSCERASPRPLARSDPTGPRQENSKEASPPSHACPITLGLRVRRTAPTLMGSYAISASRLSRLPLRTGDRLQPSSTHGHRGEEARLTEKQDAGFSSCAGRTRLQPDRRRTIRTASTRARPVHCASRTRGSIATRASSVADGVTRSQSFRSVLRIVLSLPLCGATGRLNRIHSDVAGFDGVLHGMRYTSPSMDCRTRGWLCRTESSWSVRTSFACVRKAFSAKLLSLDEPYPCDV